ncbi:MAG: hypothetical protein ACKOW9_05525 [Candidatus Paceibacterota bacterium]
MVKICKWCFGEIELSEFESSWVNVAGSKVCSFVGEGADVDEHSPKE